MLGLITTCLIFLFQCFLVTFPLSLIASLLRAWLPDQFGPFVSLLLIFCVFRREIITCVVAILPPHYQVTEGIRRLCKVYVVIRLLQVTVHIFSEDWTTGREHGLLTFLIGCWLQYACPLILIGPLPLTLIYCVNAGDWAALESEWDCLHSSYAKAVAVWDVFVLEQIGFVKMVRRFIRFCTSRIPQVQRLYEDP